MLHMPGYALPCKPVVLVSSLIARIVESVAPCSDLAMTGFAPCDPRPASLRIERFVRAQIMSQGSCISRRRSARQNLIRSISIKLERLHGIPSLSPSTTIEKMSLESDKRSRLTMMTPSILRSF